MNAPKIDLIKSSKAAQMLFAKHCYNAKREAQEMMKDGMTLDQAVISAVATRVPYFTDASIDLIAKTIRISIERGYN